MQAVCKSTCQPLSVSARCSYPMHHFVFCYFIPSSETWSSFTCLVRVTPRYFILFVAILKGVISLTSFSACLFFEYKKTSDLLELILKPATLLKLFISCRSSLVEFFGSHKYTIVSSANSDNLTSSFPICIPLTSLCYLIALARTSGTILKRYGEKICHARGFAGLI